MPATAQIVTLKDSQVVLLPTEFHINTREVWASQNTATGVITLKLKCSEDETAQHQQDTDALLKMIAGDPDT